MKRFVIFLVITFCLLFYSIALAGKPQEGPSYRGLPLKAMNTCIDVCGETPDAKDLEASYDYQMCVADCHPKIYLLHQELCTLYEITGNAPPTLCFDCGNGYQEPLEECDDGNLNNGDGCNADCLIEECDDGITRACGTTDVGVCSYGNETCVNGIWSGNCVGEINPSAETCDSQDNDCDGETDEGCSSEFCDTDDDFYFSDSFFCGGSDCDDGNSDINPAIIENIFINCGDGIDNDCDGSDIICFGG